MDNNEKKIVENLDYMTQDTEVPESLKPENVEKMLRDHQLEQKKSKKAFHWKQAYTRAGCISGSDRSSCSGAESRSDSGACVRLCSGA